MGFDASTAMLSKADGTELMFEGASATGALRGLCLEMQVEQRFRNTTKDSVEVVYTFPLPWRAVLLGVDVKLGTRQLVGSVSEKAEAGQKYEDTLADGDAAIMLERNHDQSYTLNLGNLAAKEPCVVTVRYAQALAFEQDGLRLLIPATIAPRYGDMVRDGGLQPHQAPGHDLLAEYGFDLTLNLHGTMARARIASPSHPISVLGGDDQSVVSLARQARLDRDFILVLDQLNHDSVAVQGPDFVGPEQAALLASLRVRLPAGANQNLACKILVDCSGSMGGDSIEAAKRALRVIMDQFRPGDRFSLSRFGSEVEHRGRALWKSTDATRMAGRRWVDALDADMGGTEMEGALVSTFALAHTGNCDVLLVTDGEISAIDATVAAAKASAHRLFVVGIGSSPAETHIRRLALATGGACDFVAPGEAVEPAVLRMFHRLRSSRMDRVKLEWPAGQKPIWHSPVAGSVFDGDAVSLLAQFKNPFTGVVRLVGAPDQTAAPVVLASASAEGLVQDGGTLSRIAASARVEALDRVKGKVAAASRSKAREMAVAYQLVSAHTNFLLTLQREEGERAKGMPRLHKVAQMMAAGHSGMGSASMSMASFPPSSVSMMMARSAPMHDSYGVAMSVSCDLNFGIDAQMDALEMPSFLLRESSVDFSAQMAPEEALPAELLRLDSPGYTGLSPLGLVQWLHVNDRGDWPTTFAGLRAIGIGQELVDWLELVVGAAYQQQEVVSGFIVAVLEHMLSHAGTPPISLLPAVMEFLGEQGARQLGSGTRSVPVAQTLASALIRRELMTPDIGQWNLEAFRAVAALEDC